MNFRFKILCILVLLVSSQFTFAASECGMNFVKYVQGEMPADISKNPMINMWDERFDPDQTLKVLNKNSNAEISAYIEEISKFVHKDQTFNNNLTLMVSKLYNDKKIKFSFIDKKFLKKDYIHTSFYFSKSRNELISTVNLSPEKLTYVKNLVKKQTELSDFYKAEYAKTLIQSNRSLDEIVFAIDHGMTLRGNATDLEQFKRYFEFLDNVKDHQIKKGLKDIEKIYVYEFKSTFTYNPFLPLHKRFLAQNNRVDKYLKKRTREIERGLKLQQKNGLIDEIDEAAQREANSIKVHIQEKIRFKKKIDEMEIPSAMKTRALQQARHESNIFRRMLNGCNSGNSQRIAGAAKKFSRFKFALALGGTPIFYISKNKDKMKSDQFFWEKLGHELTMGLVFTWVGNKIFTNSSSTFWGKYFEGHLKFTPLSYMEAYSYEELFGKKSLMRYLQKLYKSDVPPSELESEFERLKASPTFEKDVNELFSYLEEKSKKRNTKNFFDKYFNLSTYSSVDDKLKITQEDLESEEAREMMMELIAERIYLQNMGQWPIFQTGRKDTDRFTFYKTRNILWDVKGLAVNLAIFEMMCREPFGKIGSWGAILGLVFGDQYINGNFTYQYRREAINQ
jgi:hypothetical protein